ncbi:MAG: anti-sigma factor antagonist [Planctomycetota bacterium]|nr:MAG: anti-sigma factor antagonist [Planctomycetota bacterium]
MGKRNIMPDLHIEEQELEEGVVLLDASGFLDAFTVEDLREKFQELFDRGCNRIIVKLDNLTYISSAGAGAFIEANQLANDGGGKLVILNPSQNVYGVFDLLGLIKILNITKDLNKAKIVVQS